MKSCEAGTSRLVAEDYDVFLNHRGPDVKATFVAHLDDALTCAGFRPFLDARSLLKGNPAFRSIDHALEMAKVHVAIVSRRYAESKYCLTELVAMMRSGKPVIPVFYDVEPVDLRWVENGPFAEAFEKHKRKGRSEEVQEWRDALGALAEITGYRLADYKRDEAQLKREVVNKVAQLTPSNDPVDVEQYRVGLEGPAHSCIQILDKWGAGTGMLGLVGMGGIGKTTLAREIYNHYVSEKKFRHMTFLEIHRDSSTSNVQVRPTSSRKLRKQLLWDILREKISTSNYSSKFRKLSTVGPVFIVIDDVHKLGQFEELVPFTSIIGPGSRIVVTSRDQSILDTVVKKTNNHYLFDVQILGFDDANHLFNWHTFGAKEAPPDYEELAKDVVEACGGLPLALKVIGSSLSDKRSHEDRETIWPEAIDSLRQSTDVMGVLRWSYDCLQDLEKVMFVDISCLFYDQDARKALEFWKSCKDYASCGGLNTLYSSLQRLVDKNLIKWDYLEKLRIHDLLRDLGQEIGCKAKSHFMEAVTAETVVIKSRGTEKTKVVNLEGSRKRKFEAENFANMPNLHFLVLPDGCIVDGDFTFMSRELRWLQWRGMPFSQMPAGLHLSHLISLDFSRSSNLASLWTESNVSLEACPNLLQLELSDCTSISTLPDSLGQSLRLKSLLIDGCKNLKKLPESIGQLKVLHFLNLSDCTSLEALPDTIGDLSNLQILFAARCNSLLRLSTSIRRLSSLRTLNIQASTKCESISEGIGEAWGQLRSLTIFNCGELGFLLNYGALQRLGDLHLRISTLTELPDSIRLLTGLSKLELSCKNLQCLPESIGNLKMLDFLVLSHCDNLKKLPKALGALTSLKWLLIMCCPIRRLPKSIGLLSRLQSLEIKGCCNLQKLPTSIKQLESLQEFQLLDCGSIEAMGALSSLQGLPIWGSTSITKLPPSLGVVYSLVVYGDSRPYVCPTPNFSVGKSQVLEEDHGGFLKAYEDKLSGLTILLRGLHSLDMRFLLMN